MNTINEKLPRAFSSFLVASIVALAMSCHDGSDGLTSLMNVTNEAAGAKCLDGGLKVETGIDTNRNGTLDAGEVQQTEFVCNGVNNQNTLTKYTTEHAGSNCGAGGQKIETGRDSNGDGTLEENEIQQTMFVCNGMNGVTLNEIRVKITSNAGNPGQGTGFSYTELFDFDIRNYPGIDSVIFVVDNALSYEGFASFQLDDATHSTYIDGSIVSTTVVDNVTYKGVRLYSENILSKLPQSKADFNVALTKPGQFDHAFLFLYDVK